MGYPGSQGAYSRQFFRAHQFILGAQELKVSFFKLPGALMHFELELLIEPVELILPVLEGCRHPVEGSGQIADFVGSAFRKTDVAFTVCNP